MTIKDAIIFVLTNRDMYGSPVESKKLCAAVEAITGEKISDVQLRDQIRNICLEDGMLIGGTRNGFLIAQSKEEAREIHSWIAYRIDPLIKHSRHFEQLATSKFHDFMQESLF